MRERIRVFLALCFYCTGLVHLALWWKRRSGPRLIILNYHRAVGKNLRPQLRFLSRHYRIMHLEDALEELYASSLTERKKRDQRIPLVLTFDDGYLDNYTYGLQLARELRIPITIFLIPGYVEEGSYFWWQADDYLVAHTKANKVTVEGCVYRLPTHRKALAQLIDKRTRHAVSVEQREAFLKDIQQTLNVSLPNRKEAGITDTSLPMSWAEICEMERSGLVSFGAHTMHHPLLAYLTDDTELQQEVQDCRQVLEQHLGHPVRTFAYPVGKHEHIGEQGIQAVKAAGYQWAVTTIEDVNAPQTDPYLLRRLPGDVEQHWLVMACELAGLLGVLSRLRKKR